MTLKVMDAGGVLRTITSLKVKDGTTLRRLLRLKVMDTDGTTLRIIATFAPPLSLTVTGTRFNVGSGSVITSAPVTAAPTGGLGPYSYSWAQISGEAMTITAPASATTSFSATVPPDGQFQGVFRCTCSDSAGQTATADADVEFDNIST